MTAPINTALIGLQAALKQLERVSTRIANPSSESNLVEDIVELNSAEHAFRANAAVIRAADDIAQITIDLLIR